MTVPVHTQPGHIWWLVTSPAGRVLVPDPPDTNPTDVVLGALHLMGHKPVIEVMGPDGKWFTPAGPIPVAAFTQRRYPDRLVDACTARHATQDDVDLHYQTPRQVTP